MRVTVPVISMGWAEKSAFKKALRGEGFRLTYHTKEEFTSIWDTYSKAKTTFDVVTFDTGKKAFAKEKLFEFLCKDYLKISTDLFQTLFETRTLVYDNDDNNVVFFNFRKLESLF